MMKGKGIMSEIAAILLAALVSAVFAFSGREFCAYASEASSPSDAQDSLFSDDVSSEEIASPSEAVLSHGGNVTPSKEDINEPMGEEEPILPETGGIGSFWPVLSGMLLLILSFSFFRGKGVKTLSLVLMLTLILPSGRSTLAAVPEKGQAGSVTVSMIDEDTLGPVSGGELTLYRAGRVILQDGMYVYSLTEDFADSGVNIGDLDSAGLADAALARKLADFAIDNEISGITLPVAENGLVRFDMVLEPSESARGLPNGVYLFLQNKEAPGYYTVRPFLVTVPLYDESSGMYVYEVDAAPKTQPLEKKPDEIPEETMPQTDTDETKPEPASEEETFGEVSGGGSGHSSGSHSGSSKTNITGDSSGNLDDTVTTENIELDFTDTVLSPTGEGHSLLVAVCLLAFSGLILAAVLVYLLKKKEKK